MRNRRDRARADRLTRWEETPRLDAGGAPAWTFFSIAFLQVGFGIWAYVLILKGIAEVQGFSAWKALGNVVLSGLVILVPIVALGLVFIAVRP